MDFLLLHQLQELFKDGLLQVLILHVLVALFAAFILGDFHNDDFALVVLLMMVLVQHHQGDIIFALVLPG